MGAVPSRTFRHGVHPAGHKESTEGLAIQRMPFGDTFVLPLGQHIGAPARPVVKPGDAVRRGQLLAEPGGFVSTALHSPVTGTVVAIERRRHHQGGLVDAIVVQADPYDDQQLAPSVHPDWRSKSPRELAALVQLGGLVGLGGAAFPSHVKLTVPEGKRCHTMVINGAECEPYLTCDHRMMLEHPDRVIAGSRIAGEAAGAERVVIGIEDNKPAALAALQQAAAAAAPAGALRVEVRPLHTKYPQGAEKILIKALFGDEVPPGRLPLDSGYVVNNVATMAVMADWLEGGKPLMERVVTVSGPGVRDPANLLVPIGTSIRAVLEFCGLRGEIRQVVMGGPMMGQPVSHLDAPVLKGTSGLLVFTEQEQLYADAGPCIRCGRCLEACAYDLNPSLLGRQARAGRVEAMENTYLMDCMECGACTFACPSQIPLVQLFRAAKAELRRKQARERAREKAAETVGGGK